MAELVWLNGEVLPMSEARIGVEDRGFQFADGVYEVVRIYGGKLFMLEQHLRRLKNSAEGIRLTIPMEISKLARELSSFVSRIGILEGMIYLQLTRGVSPRNHLIMPSKPTMLFYVRTVPEVLEVQMQLGVKLLSVPDDRWQRCWIKSIALLPNVLAKSHAIEQGADDAVFIDNGFVTECSASNIFMVVGGKMVTHPVGRKVLGGVTREMIMDLAREIGLGVEEQPMLQGEAMKADEVFATSTTREISWATSWNGNVIAKSCGNVTRSIHAGMRKRFDAFRR